MELLIDVRWLLERQTEVLPKQPEVHDFSGLAAAVARHRVSVPAVGAAVDSAWRAAVLLHTVVRLRPLPARNALYGAAVAVAYMNAAGEAVAPPRGAMIDLARDIDAGRTDGYGTADRIRSWRV